MIPVRSRTRRRRSALLAWLVAAVPLSGAQTSISGQLTAYGSLGLPRTDSALRTLGGRELIDHTVDLRLMADATLGDDLSLQIHDDIAATGGDTRAAGVDSGVPAFDATAGPDDDRRLVDLSADLHRGARSLAFQRLDRLALRWTRPWGAVTVGRSAITWGNGLVFNVQDLFNPFDPTDFVRDYKTGDDMVLVETRLGDADWQLLAVPRRDPSDGRFSAAHSSLAAHIRFSHGGVEWTGFAGMHHDEPVAGLGRVETVGDAIWRSDILLGHRNDGGLILSALTNLDRSWVWWGRNCYGFLEAHYSSLGHDDPWSSLRDPDLRARLDRGEVFTLGPAYLAGMLQVEFHPLLNGAVTAIADLAGPSALLQPRLMWDARENLQLMLGAQFGLGRRGTEYGGIVDPATGLSLAPPPAAFLRLTAWF